MITIIDKLRAILLRYTEDQSIAVKANMQLLTDFGLNSLELVEMVCEVEEEFGIEISDRAISGIKTVQDLLDIIASQAPVQA